MRDGPAAKVAGAKSLAGLLKDALKLPPAVIVSSFVINLLGLALPLVVLQIFDRVLRYQALNTLTLLILGLCCVVAAETVLRFARNRLVGDRALRESFGLSMRGATGYLNAPRKATSALPDGAAVDGMAAIDDMNQFLSGSGRLALLDMPFIALFLLLIWTIAGAIVLLPIILIIGFTVWTIWSSASFKALLNEQVKLERQRFDFYAEALKGIATVKSLAIEPQIQRRFEKILHGGAELNYKLVLRANRMAAAGQLFASLTIISIITVGGFMAIDGAITIGAVAACLLIGNRVTQPVLRIIGLWSQLESARLAQDRYHALMSLPRDAAPSPEQRGPASLDLRGVSMNISPEPLDHGGVNLSLRPGEVTGIVIPNFTQRAQMLHLVRGQIKPDNGRVLIDGLDLASAEGEAMQRSVFFLGSEPDIFHGSILDNISMFRRVSHAAALDTARILGVEAIIQALPQGYDTRLGDIGAAALPADILQAICVVRATAVRPRILLIDIRRIPPDDVGTRACARAIEELRGVTTVLLIGKHMSEVRDAGRVFSLQDWSLQEVSETVHRATDEGGDKLLSAALSQYSLTPSGG